MTSLFPRSNPLRSSRSVLNVSNGVPWNPKLTLKVNSLGIKIKAQNVVRQVLSKHTFKIWTKKGSDFLITGALKSCFFFFNQFKMALWEAGLHRSLILVLLFCAKRKKIHSLSMDTGVTAALVDKGCLWMAWTGKWFTVIYKPYPGLTRFISLSVGYPSPVPGLPLTPPWKWAWNRPIFRAG